MRRWAFIVLLFIAFNMSVNAREGGDPDFPRMTFGLEWGYVATLQSGYHYNFFAPEGYRVDDYGNAFKYHSNADVYVHLGYNLNHLWNISLYLGYAGVDDIHNVMPVSLRTTRFFGDDHMKDRWFGFVDLGSGICIKKPVQEILAGKIGGGYRLSLSRDTKLDFVLAVRMTYTHPQIIYDKAPIPIEMTNRNNAYVGAVSLGLALTF